MAHLHQGALEAWGYVELVRSFCFRRIGNWEKAWFTIVEGVLYAYTGPDRSHELLHEDIRGCEFYDAGRACGFPCSLNIRTPAGASLHVRCDDLRAVDDMKLELEHFGGTFRGAEAPTPVVHEHDLERVPCDRWTVEQCCQWLDLIGCEQLQGKFEDNGVTGAVLLSMDLSTFQSSLQLEREFAVTVFDEVRDIKFNGNVFMKKRSVVRRKFQKFQRDNDIDPTETDPLVDALCDPVRIKHKFLSTAERYFEKEVRAYDSLRGGSPPDSTTPTLSDDAPDPMVEGRPEPFNTTRVRIKLVVTESVMNSRSLNLRKAISPFAASSAQSLRSPKFQYFRTAVIVGPWYLEWTDSELIVPKRMVSGRAVITADVDTLFVKREGLLEISDKIAEVVAKWNTKYKYNAAEGPDARRVDAEYLSGNCQDFVDDVLNALDVQPQFGGALGDFIQKMRLEGRADLQYVPCPEFVEYFRGKDVFTEDELQGVQFETHQLLDAFCAKVAENCFDINTLFPSDWLLLKSFDRAFWMRHLQHRDDEKYAPLPAKRLDMSEFPTGCPFKDPRETISIMV